MKPDEEDRLGPFEDAADVAVGATPLSNEEARLKPAYIATSGELNVAEQENIAKAHALLLPVRGRGTQSAKARRYCDTRR